MKRDKYGIIIQPNGIKVNGVPTDDGGDSAFSTGLSAFGGSEQDFQLMPLFIIGGKLVRHPYQNFNTGTAPHNDPSSTSRDQVKAFFSGLLGRANEPTHAEVKKACLNYAKGWRVNGDILSPADKEYLYICAGESAPWWLKIMAAPLKSADLLFNCYINPKHEMNQAVVSNVAFGQKWITFLFNNHPDLFGNITEYFCGWRERCYIASGMKGRVLSSVTRK